MAKIPDPLARRHLIEKGLTSDEALAIAEAYIEVGRVPEAVIFLQKAEARERLGELVDLAVEQGDAFLLRELSQAMGEEPTHERWQALAAAADGAGKALYVDTATRFSTRTED